MHFFDPSYSLEKPIKWIFTVNQLYIDLIAIGVFIFLYLVLPKKNRVLVNLTKIFFATLLVGLEIARIFYTYKRHLMNGGTWDNFDLVAAISFQQCAMMVWFTAATLILSTFLKKDNILLKYMYNICFSCALIGALSTLIYPENLSEKLPLWHFRNLQTYITHSTLVFVPIYLIKTKDLEPKIKDCWMTLVGYIYIGCISMTVSIVEDHNFAFAKRVPLDTLPQDIFPWHLEALFVLMFGFGLLMYAIMELIYFIKRKKNNIKLEPYKATFNNSYYPIAGATTAIIASFMLMLIAQFVGEAKTIKGLYCLIPLFYMILTLIIIEISKKYLIETTISKRNFLIFSILFSFLNPIITLIIGIEYFSKNKSLNDNF